MQEEIFRWRQIESKRLHPEILPMPTSCANLPCQTFLYLHIFCAFRKFQIFEIIFQMFLYPALSDLFIHSYFSLSKICKFLKISFKYFSILPCQTFLYLHIFALSKSWKIIKLSSKYFSLLPCQTFLNLHILYFQKFAKS